jgi:hypothetical protein
MSAKAWVKQSMLKRDTAENAIDLNKEKTITKSRTLGICGDFIGRDISM